MNSYETALFIFRRDLRLEDNTGLIFALKNAKKVIPCFIFTPEQIKKNPYRSDRCLQFMIESLEDLGVALKDKKGKLYLFFDKPEIAVASCIKKLKIDAVIVNKDYTPYSIKRDRKIETLCKKEGIPFHAFDDALLHPPETTLKSDGKPYTIFTPFFRNASRLKVALPAPNRLSNYYSAPIPFDESDRLYSKILPKRLPQSKGGRTAALKILKNLKKYAKYPKERDFPAVEGTTHLSAHLKFTTISPRETFYAISKQLSLHSELIRSLYWRDFFTSIAYYFPEIFGHSFHKKFDRLSWSYDKRLFNLWCQGKTGFPLIDAGMREMNQTGFMHNRVRMIAATFLVKDLHIDWRWGEKYFAQHLIDYDPALNNGNWQWSASTGCDAQPYFRIFNPWTQQTKFDPECLYIKRWIPELASVPVEKIHSWHLEKNRDAKFKYPLPIIDHAKEAALAIRAYKAAK